MHIIGKPEQSKTELVGIHDANGRFCAGIQVISDMEGFKYDAYNGVVKVDDKPGMDLVYLQPDERVLEVFHSGYEPLKLILSEIGIELEGKRVWQIKLSGEKKLTSIPLVIVTDPSPAKIYIDGKDAGTTEQPHKVTVGSHQIRLEKTGYKPLIKTIIVDENNTLFKYTLAKQQDANIIIETDPSDATLFINDVKLGQSPVNNFYPTGRYTLRIEKEHYVTFQDYIDVQAPQTHKTITLKPDYAVLTVTSTPKSDMEIYFNNVSQKVTTPHTFQYLPPGDYEIKARSTYYETDVVKTSLARGDKKTVTLQSKASFATLSINTHPGATVYMNGKPITQLKNIRLEPSIVVLRAEMPKAEPVQQRIVLQKNENRTIDLFPNLATCTIQVACVPFDAIIELTGDAGEHYSATGAKIFSDIPIGTYKLEITKRNYIKYHETLRCNKDDRIKRSVKLHAALSRGLGLLTVLGSPEGAFVKAGAGDGLGRLPLNKIPIKRGAHKIKVTAKGYESVAKNVNILQNEESTLRIQLKRKTRGKAFIRSFFIPGLGQFYAEHSGRGILFLLGEAGAIVGAGYFHHKYDLTKKHFWQAKSDYSAAVSQDDMDRFFNTMQTSYKRAPILRKKRNKLLGAAAGIWLVSVLDAVIFASNTERGTKIGMQQNKKLRLYANQTTNKTSIGLYYRF